MKSNGKHVVFDTIPIMIALLQEARIVFGRLLGHEAYGRRVRALQGEGRGFPLTFCLFVTYSHGPWSVKLFVFS